MALKTEDTREHILKIAIELFLKRGFKSVTMHDLEQSTGLTKGAFYHYFKDKVEIFEASVKRILEFYKLNIDLEVEKSLTLQAFIEMYLVHLNKTSYYLHSIVDDNVMDTQLGNMIGDICTYIPSFHASIKLLLDEEVKRWNRIIHRAKEREEIASTVDCSVVANLFLNIPESIKRNRIIGVNIRSAVNNACEQYEQLYSLIKS